ncbi:hypothetical protein GCM10010975_36300 [Comamonas phosphati]|nr:hypothetical protein GCM10010975_36300 [Comamonas phosphati]
MHELRSARRFSRFLMAWLLLWFVAMAMPLKGLDVLEDAWSATVSTIGPNASDICTYTEGEATGVYQIHDAEVPGSPSDLHSGHASGDPSHCPLCLQAAAPPGSLLARIPGSGAPSEPRYVQHYMHEQVRTDVPPPARAPPVFS